LAAASVDENGEIQLGLPEDPLTWIFDEGSFSPAAKLQGDESFSIVSDYLGKPEQMYDSAGELTWDAEYDIYGNIRKLRIGSLNDCPFRFPGQYADDEVGLYYNRFRYYDPRIGGYVSQDPIGLMGNNPNIYAYTPDSLSWIDQVGFGCTKAFKKKLGFTQRWVKKLTGKSSDDIEELLTKKGWAKSRPQAAFPDRIQHTRFTKKTKAGDTYVLDYHPGAIPPQTNIHGNDYWKTYKLDKAGNETVYGRIGHGEFGNYDEIVDSPVFIDGVLVN
jgi:RHS repeat-associated protein